MIVSAERATDLGAADLPGGSHPARAAVCPEDDVRVEHRDQALEVAASDGGDERVDHRSLGAQVAIRRRADSRTRRRARLASCRVAVGVRPRIGAISVERQGKHVVQDERDSLGGRERLEQHEERQAEGVAEKGLVLRIHPVGAIDDRLGHAAG